MNIVAVIPVKPLAQGKQRIAAVLDIEARQRLIQAMLDGVVNALQGSAGIAQIRILTSDAALVRVGSHHLVDRGDGLNASLASAAHTLCQEGADAMLVIPADLPFVTSADIDRLIANARPGRAVMVPDARGSGTNALLLAPPTLFVPHFGSASASAHQRAALTVGADVVIHRSYNLGRDIDEPGDLAMLMEGSETRFNFLRSRAEALCE
jgi:2-phospho-L-lactate/phosphoenolpyruvate guanylyltransferase